MKILLVEDIADDREALSHVLRQGGHEVVSHANAENALAQKEGDIRSFDVAILDWQLPGKNGLELGQALFAVNPRLFLVMLTAYGTLEREMTARRYGGFIHFISKPGSSEALDVIKFLEKEVQQRRDLFKKLQGGDSGIVGISPAINHIKSLIAQFAPSDIRVLITGETGTGKELVARSIWRHSRRAGKPFSAVNCSAIPDNLIESELFGHEKSSFTGATARRIGKFEQCDQGTIFLDEIGDMALATQAKILRVLQEGEIQRVGGTATVKVDVRVIAATHCDLAEMVTNRTFREDLRYRIDVMRIPMPPLQERGEDVLLLAQHFLNRFNKSEKKTIREISEPVRNDLLRHSWPGNVRELENLIHKAVVFEKSSILSPSSLADFCPASSRDHDLVSQHPTEIGAAPSSALKSRSSDKNRSNFAASEAQSGISSSSSGIEIRERANWERMIEEHLEKLETAFPEALKFSELAGKPKVRHKDLGKAIKRSGNIAGKIFRDSVKWGPISGVERAGLIRMLAQKYPDRWPGLRGERSLVAKCFH